jgi:hypothetical protein
MQLRLHRFEASLLGNHKYLKIRTREDGTVVPKPLFSELQTLKRVPHFPHNVRY